MVQLHFQGANAIQESPIFYQSRLVGFHSTLVDEEGQALGSGTHAVRETSHKIAVFEAFERKIFNSMFRRAEPSLFLNEYPSSCGFAVGDEPEDAEQRAKSEAVERWIRSKWIDDQYRLTPHKILPSELSPIAKSLLQSFDDYSGFYQTCALEGDPKGTNLFHNAIFVGFTKTGAFVGSRTSNDSHRIWDHAIIEAWRHLHIYRTQPRDSEKFEIQIIHFFGENKLVALEQLEKANRPGLPNPRLKLLSSVPTGVNGVYCARALCDDFKGWHHKEVDRFVY